MLAEKFTWEAMDFYNPGAPCMWLGWWDMHQASSERKQSDKLANKKPTKPHSQQAHPQRPYNSHQNSTMTRHVVISASRPNVKSGPTDSCFRWHAGVLDILLWTARQPYPCPHAERHFDQASQGCSVVQSDQRCDYNDPVALASSLFDMYGKLGITEHEMKDDVYSSAVDFTTVGSPVYKLLFAW